MFGHCTPDVCFTPFRMFGRWAPDVTTDVKKNSNPTSPDF